MKKKTFCLFGTFKISYSRNDSIRDGLERLGHTVTIVHHHISDERLEVKEDFTLLKSLHRVLRKVKAYVQLALEYKTVAGSDHIIVLHPGHLDLPLAKLFSFFSGASLIFDGGVSPYDIMFEGRNIASKNSFKAKAVKFVETQLLKLPDLIFADTREMAEYMIDHFSLDAKKVFYTPIGANDLMYTPPQKHKRNKKTEVFFFGLFNPMHGLPYIMEAAKKLKARNDIHFTILGDGYLKNELHSFVEKNALTNVSLLGFVPEKKLVEEIQKCDIMLGVFTNSATFQKVIPNKVFAGLACEKAVISANHPPYKGLLKHKDAIYLCKPESTSSLVRAITILSEDTTLRKKIASKGYQMYKKFFTPEHIAQKIIQAIETKDD